ncbi:MAG: hypothetical protein ACYCR4_11645 [Acidimicrobiales bacterium]
MFNERTYTDLGIAQLSPPEIDACLAGLARRRRPLEAAMHRLLWVRRRDGRVVERELGSTGFAELAKLRSKIAELVTEATPYEKEFVRRGGWSRFFLCLNAEGHVHSSLACTTLRRDTQMAWLPELSGRTESEMVAEHGNGACTVCFPSAPTMAGFDDGTSARARRSAEERAARDAEAAARRTAKVAKALVRPVRGSHGTVRTVAAAKQEIRDAIRANVWYGETADRLETIRAMRVALAEKGMDEGALDELCAKARKRAASEM